MNERKLQLKCRPIQVPLRKPSHWQSGQSLVEAALSITLLVILFSGVVDLGRAFYVKIALDNAVGEGAHYASIFPNCVATANQIDNIGSGNCTGTNSIWGRIMDENTDLNKTQMGQVTVTDNNGNNPPQTLDTITITASYNLNMLTPFVQATFGKTFTLYSSV